LIKRIERIVMLVGKFPRMGRLTDRPDMRVIGIPQYRYLIFYRILDERDEMRILRVRHTSRRPLEGYR
jgi:plasmid stabilization system protein ParE